MTISATIEQLKQNISRVIVGKDDSIELLVASLLAGGHVLLEDVPGLGKTMLARSLAKSIVGRFQRVQCTPDLLPSDITGVSIFNEQSRQFEFKPGPVFANILLVDEINRTTPRTQSSLLEAMAEKQVSADGKTYRLPAPYMVIATQNPIENHGTYPLPEAQLDRFLMKLSMGYPTLEEEVAILHRQQKTQALDTLAAVINAKSIVKLQNMVKEIHIETSVANYIARIVHATRQHKSLAFGASPRGSLALMRSAQAIALIRGQGFVDPQTIKTIAKPVLAHRITLKPQHQASQNAESVVDEILEKIQVPIGQNSGLNAKHGPAEDPVRKTTPQATPKTPDAIPPAPNTTQGSRPQKKNVETTDTGMELIDL